MQGQSVCLCLYGLVGSFTHGARDLAFTDRREREALPLVLHVSQGFGLVIGSRLDRKVLLDGHANVARGDGVLKRSGRGRHDG